MNKIKIVKSDADNKIQVSLGETWDFSNREDLINSYSEGVMYELIGSGIDYEIARFAKAPTYISATNSNRTLIRHEFNFYNPDTATWSNTYINPNYFTFDEIKNNSKSFKNSFFKLDLYDYMEQSKRKNFLTLILQNSQNTFNYTHFNRVYEIKKPDYSLDYLINPEGFFIYWFKDSSVLNLNNLFMTAKFFNAKTGEFVTFLNKQTNQTKILDSLFYYKVNFNFNNYTYFYTETNNNTEVETIRWYEYLNPQN